MSFVLGKTGPFLVQTNGAETKTILEDAVGDLADGVYEYALHAIGCGRDGDGNLASFSEFVRALFIVQSGALVRRTGPDGGPEVCPGGYLSGPPLSLSDETFFGSGAGPSGGFGCPTTDPDPPLAFTKITMTGTSGYLVDWSWTVERRQALSSGASPS